MHENLAFFAFQLFSPSTSFIAFVFRNISPEYAVARCIPSDLPLHAIDVAIATLKSAFHCTLQRIMQIHVYASFCLATLPHWLKDNMQSS